MCKIQLWLYFNFRRLSKYDDPVDDQDTVPGQRIQIENTWEGGVCGFC